jgi:FkbM family methyltransferase
MKGKFSSSNHNPMMKSIRRFLRNMLRKDWNTMTKYRVPCGYDVPYDINIIYEDIFGYKTDGYFVEVGAFDGEIASFTCHLADIGWTGHYVEPITKYFRQCSQRHKNNKVSCHNFFVGNETGKSTMHDYGPFSRKNIINHEMSIQEKGETIDIDCITMDAFLKNNHIPGSFDLLVIDVEDGELNVLKSFLSLGRESCPTAIIIETENGAEVKKFMSQAGYVRYCSFDTENPSTKNDVFVSLKRAEENFPFLDQLKKRNIIQASAIKT